jgi:hypothetical protein
VTGEEDAYGDDGGSDHWPADEATVTCPHCGETVVIALDPAGGSRQEYVEDCQICCRPWRVQVHYAGGSVDVAVTIE